MAQKSKDRRSVEVLAALLPAGVASLSIGLAAADSVGLSALAAGVVAAAIAAGRRSAEPDCAARSGRSNRRDHLAAR